MIHVTRTSPLPTDLTLAAIRRIAGQTLNKMGVSGDVSLVFTENNAIQKLNREYRKIDSSTDVLSFPSDEIDPMTNSRYLGDIIISVEKAKEQSLLAGRPFLDELSMLIVHGCLHLCGLDHLSVEEKEYMKSYQESILSSLGVKNFSWPESD
jgi:probable rRNA maturation factor